MSTRKQTSTDSRLVWVDKMALYGSTIAGAIYDKECSECFCVGSTLSNLRRRVDGEFKPGHLAIAGGDLLHEERRESGASAASKRVEHKKALHAI